MDFFSELGILKYFSIYRLTVIASSLFVISDRRKTCTNVDLHKSEVV